MDRGAGGLRLEPVQEHEKSMEGLHVPYMHTRVICEKFNIYTCIYRYASIYCAYLSMYIHTYVYTYMYMCVWMCVCMYIYIFLYMCLYMCVYVHETAPLGQGWGFYSPGRKTPASRPAPQKTSNTHHPLYIPSTTPPAPAYSKKAQPTLYSKEEYHPPPSFSLNPP